MKTSTRLVLIAAGALALTNCSKSAPEPTPDEANAGEVVDVSNDTLLEPTNVAEPTPTPTPTPEPTQSVDEAQQVQDDADATGMTARVTREESGPANESEAQPAEATTEKK